MKGGKTMKYIAPEQRAFLTVDEVREHGREMLTAKNVARILRMEEHAIRLRARGMGPELPFPTLVNGHRVGIPKAGFLAWMSGDPIPQEEEIGGDTV